MNSLSFDWILPNKLAISQRAENIGDFEFLHKQKIRAIVHLTDYYSDEIAYCLKRFDIEFFRAPMEDCVIPTEDTMQKILSFIDNCMENNMAVCISCFYGHSRSGFVMALYLSHMGYNCQEAIELVRKCRPGALKNPLHEKYILENGQKYR